MSARVWLRRAYDPPTRNDGRRVLVDRLWPRGLRREDLELDEWCRDVAPSDRLRRWYGHQPERWVEFQHRYRGELSRGKSRAALLALVREARRHRLTLVLTARDVSHSNAAVLREVIDEHLAAFAASSSTK